jgi:hypothetical protein
VRKSSRSRTETARPAPKDPKGRVPIPHDARTRIEETVLNLHSLASYNTDELLPKELAFINAAKRNLATMYRRLTSE